MFRNRKIVSVQWQPFFEGKVINVAPSPSHAIDAIFAASVGIATTTTIVQHHTVAFADTVVPTLAPLSSDAGWAQPIIDLLHDQAYPLAIVMGSWIGLELMLGKYATAFERLKWVVLGYIAVMYIPRFITGLAHNVH